MSRSGLNSKRKSIGIWEPKFQEAQHIYVTMSSAEGGIVYKSMTVYDGERVSQQRMWRHVA